MSDPAKTSDIEDVLSSIRRLLAQDVQPRDRMAEAVNRRAPAPEPPVASVEIREAWDAPEQVTTTEPDEAVDDYAEWTEEEAFDLHAEEPAAQEAGDEFAGAEPDEPTWVDEKALPEPDEDFAPAQVEEDAPAVAEVLIAETVEPPDEAPVAEPPADRSLEDTLAALEAAVAAHTPARSGQEPYPPEDEQVEEAPFIAIDMPENDTVTSLTVPFRPSGGRRLQLVQAPDVPEPEVEVQVDLNVEEDEPAEPEAAVLPDELLVIPEPAEPWDDEVDPPQEIAEDGDDEPADMPEVAYSDAPDDAAEEPIVAAPPEEADLDLLRAMVAEILREELQGALGERMTRNVRKLVRAEIRRALAGLDLE